MDCSKQKGYSSSSSSSIAVDLFGPKENSSSASSSSSIFSSVFGPPPTARGSNSSSGNQGGNIKHGAGGPNNETISPCHYSSSIYYGGQEVYSTPPIDTKSKNKKDGQDEDSGASRGNWWQGSVYY